MSVSSLGKWSTTVTKSRQTKPTHTTPFLSLMRRVRTGTMIGNREMRTRTMITKERLTTRNRIITRRQGQGKPTPFISSREMARLRRKKGEKRRMRAQLRVAQQRNEEWKG